MWRCVRLYLLREQKRFAMGVSKHMGPLREREVEYRTGLPFEPAPPPLISMVARTRYPMPSEQLMDLLYSPRLLAVFGSSEAILREVERCGMKFPEAWHALQEYFDPLAPVPCKPPTAESPQTRALQLLATPVWCDMLDIQELARVTAVCTLIARDVGRQLTRRVETRRIALQHRPHLLDLLRSRVRSSILELQVETWLSSADFALLHHFPNLEALCIHDTTTPGMTAVHGMVAHTLRDQALILPQLHTLVISASLISPVTDNLFPFSLPQLRRLELRYPSMPSFLILSHFPRLHTLVLQIFASCIAVPLELVQVVPHCRRQMPELQLLRLRNTVVDCHLEEVTPFKIELQNCHCVRVHENCLVSS